MRRKKSRVRINKKKLWKVKQDLEKTEETRKQNNNYSYWKVSHQPVAKNRVFKTEEVLEKLHFFLGNLETYVDEASSKEKIVSYQSFQVKQEVL